MNKKAESLEQANKQTNRIKKPKTQKSENTHQMLSFNVTNV